MNLNLGSGNRPIKGYLNLDIQRRVNPDLICDVSKGLPFKNNSIDEILAVDFIEHLERQDVLRLMDEVYRVLIPGGTFFHRTPSSEGRGAWQDPTHKSAWNINTWKFYWTHPDYRALYEIKPNFKVLELFDEVTDEENKVIHTYCLYEAVK